jgi:hypothetical protein
MKRFYAALGVSSLLAIAGALAPTSSNAQPASYIACNQYGDCWRTPGVYAYGPDAPVTYYNSDWYAAHEHDAHVHWLADHPDHGYYDRDGVWHPDPAAHVVASGLGGAGVGAAIGCLVTLPIGCAPGAAVGAAVGGGTGAVAGAASN